MNWYIISPTGNHECESHVQLNDAQAAAINRIVYMYGPFVSREEARNLGDPSEEDFEQDYAPWHFHISNNSEPDLRESYSR